MLNKEKYAKEILDIACNGKSIGMRNGVLCACNSIGDCIYCDFYGNKTICGIAIKDWANSEYKEPEIDWNKVPVDTCVLVTDSCGNTIKRHFAKYDNKIIYVYPDGTTSWSFDNQVEYNELVDYDEKNVQIKEGVDCSEWYKD